MQLNQAQAVPLPAPIEKDSFLFFYYRQTQQSLQ
jgi:hypothetical protein